MIHGFICFFSSILHLFSSLQSLSIHLTSTKGPIEVLLCRDEENDPRSPVKNGDMDINGNTPFLKVLQGLFQPFFFFALLSFNFLKDLKEKRPSALQVSSHNNYQHFC